MPHAPSARPREGDASPVSRRRIRAARDGRSVCVAVADPRLAPPAAEALAALGFTPDPRGHGPPAVRLALAGVPALPPLPAGAVVRARAGDEALLQRGGARYLTLPGLQARLGRGGRALIRLQADGAQIAPALVQGAITRVLLLLLSHAGWDTLHAAGLVSPAGPAVIITAPSGSGKSTLALGLARRGWRVLSDDLLLVDEGPAGVEVRGWLGQVRLCPDTLAAAPHLLADARPQPDGKWAVPLARLGPPAHHAAAPAWLVLPRIVDRATSVLTPVPPAAALVALAHQLNLSAGADPALTARQLARGARLVAQCRCLALAAGRDLAADPGRLADLLAAV